MSFRATARAMSVTAPSASAKLVLLVLASYAGEDGTCFPAQARIARDAQLSLRTVRDACRDLKAAGLIAAEPRRRANGSRTTDLIRLLFLDPVQAASPAAGAKRRTAPVGQRRSAPASAAPGAGPEPVREPVPVEGSDDPPTEGAGAKGTNGDFETAWRAYPEAGRRTSSRRQGLAAWAAEVAAGGDPGAMARAAGVYAGDRARWGRSGSPLSFHNFYALGRWIDCARPEADGAAAPAAPAAATPFEGPAELVEALRDRLGEAGLASWTAGARWREADRALVARTRLAAATLRDRCRAELKALGARVEDPP